MTAPVQLAANDRSPQPAIRTTPQLHLRFEDVLASARRLWVRGRLLGAETPARGSANERRWWERWRGRSGHGAPQPTIRLETRISGSVLADEATLLPDGRFEAVFTADLPVARRGWRVARHRVSVADFTAEACGVVLTPPAEAVGAVVVLLPLEYTLQPGGIQAFARSEFACRLANLLRTLRSGPRGPHPMYYLACVPPEEDTRQAEWALASTALGWPTGHFILLPSAGDGVKAGFLAGLDRLRWLFAGQLEMLVLNLEPGIAPALAAATEPAEDRALVRRLINPEDDPWKVFDHLEARPSRVGCYGPRPTRASLLPRYPIVFCHGMLAFSTLRMQLPENLNCFYPLQEFLRQRGFRVLFPQVPATSGVVERAARLRAQIRRWTDEPINVIAHSMGGLDARHMITHLDMAGQVRSLTTVSTPHRGTYLADWFVANFRSRVPLLLAMQALGINVDGFRDCRLEACREFNARTPDRPEVRYFSYVGAVSHGRVTPALRRAWNILTPVEGPNDGMVSVASARWGECLGTIHADHFAQTPDATFLRPGEDFDALGFYSRLVENLARRGF